MRKLIAWSSFVILLLLSVPCLAANHYINAACASACDGSTWAKGWATFGAVSWTRGDTYYVAGGTYNEWVLLDRAESGTTPITIKKANAADNSGNTGWNASYASDVAVITGGVEIDTSYWEIDGVTGSGTSGHGIKVDYQTLCDSIPVILCSGSGTPFSCCTGDGTGTAPACQGGVRYGFFLDTPVHDAFLHNFEINTCTETSNARTRGFYQNSYTNAAKMIHLQHVYIHNSTENGLTLLGQTGTNYTTNYGFKIEDSVVANTGHIGNGDSRFDAIHGQMFQFGTGVSQAYTEISRNIFKNSLGSGFISLLGGVEVNKMRIINNVFYATDHTTYYSSPRVIWSHSNTNTQVHDLEIYNNTFWNINLAGLFFMYPAGITNIWEKNNLFVDSVYSNGDYGVTTAATNGYYNNTGARSTGCHGNISPTR